MGEGQSKSPGEKEPTYLFCGEVPFDDAPIMFQEAFLLAVLAPLLRSILVGQTTTPPVLNEARLIGGGTFSAFRPAFGSKDLYGGRRFVDLNLHRHFGAEAEVRFLRFSQADDVHEDNYAVGLRYRWQFDRYELYRKNLVANGEFNFPFKYCRGCGRRWWAGPSSSRCTS